MSDDRTVATRLDAVLIRPRSPLYHTQPKCAAGTAHEYPSLLVTTAEHAEARDKRECRRCFSHFGYTVPMEFEMWETTL